MTGGGGRTVDERGLGFISALYTSIFDLAEVALTDFEIDFPTWLKMMMFGEHDRWSERGFGLGTWQSHVFGPVTSFPIGD